MKTQSINDTPACMEDAAMAAIRDSRPILVMKTVETTDEEHEAADKAYRLAHPWNHVISIHVIFV